MINNIQNLFIKYKISNPKNKTLELITIFFKEELNINIEKEDLKLDIKNKTVFLNKNNSAFKFFLKSKLTEDKKDLLEKELGFKINF